MSNIKIAIVGSGNVAWHLGHVLKSSSYNLIQLVSRNKQTGEELANELECNFNLDISKVSHDADIVILAVSDSSLPSLVEHAIFGNHTLLHTAGSIPIDIFKNKVTKYGVLYPFQTFTKGVNLDFSKVPLCIEASDTGTYTQIELLGKALSNRVEAVNSEQRKILHLAGIMANNFTNHFITHANSLLDKHNIDQSLLIPLLYETIAKLEKTSAYEAQTGPARRNDKQVIASHLELLDDMPELKNLYRSISDSIIALYSKET